MKRLISFLTVICLLIMPVAMTEDIELNDSRSVDEAVGAIELEIDDIEEIAPDELDDIELSSELLIEESITDESVASTNISSNDAGITVGPDSDPESIRYVQEMLIAIHALPEGSVNGVYDDATRTAVKAFQRWVNEQRNELTLEVTGLVDDLTRQYLEYCVDHGMTITDEVAISNTNFPDAVFRAYVSKEFDTNKDGYLSQSEINNVKEIDVEGANISSLIGLSYFTALEDLSCYDNNLTSLDISNNTKLIYLYCADNSIKTLDISNNPKLISALKTEGPYKYEGHLHIIPLKAMDDTDSFLSVDAGITITANGETLYSPNMTLKRTGPSTVIGLKESCGIFDAIVSEGRRPYYITLLGWNKCSYKSSASKKVKVDSEGEITGLKRDSAYITISNNGISVTCKVTVKKAPSKVTLTKKKIKMSVGQTKALKAKLPSGSASRFLTWKSSNENVAVYDDWNQSVEAIGPGTATITVKTYNGKKATCKVTVTAPEPTTLNLNTTGLYLEVGETFQIVPTIDEGASTTFSYSSKNKTIASVSSKGVVKGVKKGTTKITVKTKNGLTKSFEVQVGKSNTYKSGTSGVRVYASLSDKYFHMKNSCSKILGSPSRVTLETALNYGKQPCAECAASALKTVYIGKGKYYHYKKNHAGSGAKKSTLADALGRGYDACPDCVMNQ